MLRSYLKLFYLFPLLLTGCNLEPKEKTVFKNPPGYNFENARKIRLGEDLDEISGIGYDKTSNSLVALNDEEGKLFQVYIDGRKPSPGTRFHKGGDFEDLCNDGSSWYALKSNGTVSRIYYPFSDSARSEEFKFPVKAKYDFETIFLEPTSNRLILLCKLCKGYGKRVPGFAFYLSSGQTDSMPSFYLDYSKIPDSLLPNDQSLKPSGAAIHPITGEMYILASANNLLLITTTDGTIKEVYPLSKKKFKQPEGICFSPEGDMFISNEARGGRANIMHLSYDPAAK
jgi:hypothetical protein